MRILKTTIALFSVIILLASCDNYGKKVTKGHIETYYKDGITEDQANRSADFMYRLDKSANNPEVKKSFQLAKRNDSVVLRMVVDEARMREMPEKNFLAIGMMLSDSIFNGAPVNIDLTNNTFKTLKSLAFRKMTDADFQ